LRFRLLPTVLHREHNTSGSSALDYDAPGLQQVRPCASAKSSKKVCLALSWKPAAIGRIGGLERARVSAPFERRFTVERMTRDYARIYQALCVIFCFIRSEPST
jgi:hypothetical protein